MTKLLLSIFGNAEIVIKVKWENQNQIIIEMEIGNSKIAPWKKNTMFFERNRNLSIHSIEFLVLKKRYFTSIYDSAKQLISIEFSLICFSFFHLFCHFEVWS